MAACLRGFVPATTCAASWLQLQRPFTCGLVVCGLLSLHLGRSQPSLRMWWLCDCLLSLGELQVLVLPMPREHAAMLWSIDHCVFLAQVNMVMAAAWRRACAASAGQTHQSPGGGSVTVS